MPARRRTTAEQPTGLADRLNARCDRIVGLHVRVGRRMYGSWRVFSVAAFGTAAVTWVLVGRLGGVGVAATVLVAAVPAVLFSVHRRLVLRSDGPVRLILHRDVAAWLAVLLPALAALDSLTGAVADAGVAAVLVGNAVGRVGCLRSGCCVGVPGPVGPVYPWLGGVRRQPVQLYEAAACLLIAAGLVALVLAGAPPGRPALAGLGAYAVVRYGLDYLRAERARLGRATEAQWVMAALAAACAAWWLAG